MRPAIAVTHARQPRSTIMSASFELTPEIIAKREERARKRALAMTLEAKAAAASQQAAAIEAKRVARRERDAEEAQLLAQWAVRDKDESICELVDIGANLVKLKGDGKLEQQLRRCTLTGVSRILVTGTSVGASRRALELAQGGGHSTGVQLFSTVGVHPHDAKSADGATLSVLRELAQAAECVAIGECGLDYDRMFSPRDVQLRWFEAQAHLAAELDMPCFIHERDLDSDKGAPLGSAADVMRVLDEASVRPERVCIHCFTGSVDVLRAYADRGYRIGLTGFVCMAERGAHVREALRDGVIPLSQLMLETDSPFMKPDKEYLPEIKSLKRGQNEPCCVPAVCRAVAECYSLPAAAVARATTANAIDFFGLPES
jgi:TatD DNase family protein